MTIATAGASNTPPPRHWTKVLLAPLEMLALVWSLPFVILLIGIPLVLAVALVHWLGRLTLSCSDTTRLKRA